MERHEIDFNKREQDELNMQYQWEAFKPDAIARVVDCFKNNGDLLDLMNELDGDWDDYHSLDNDQINDIVLSAALKFSSDEEDRKDKEHEGQTHLEFEHDSTEGWKIITDHLGGAA